MLFEDAFLASIIASCEVLRHSVHFGWMFFGTIKTVDKLSLKNKKGFTMVGTYELPQGRVKGTAIIQHGLGGFKEGDHIQVLKDCFLEHGFQTFNFDTTNSFNESGGKYEDSTLGLHYEDLEDVVKWVQKQEWFKKPLALTGHSMGGYAVARYAEEYPDEVGLLVPVAPVVSGNLSFEAHERFEPEELKKWKKEGWREKESGSIPGLIKRTPWSHMEERLNHNLLLDASKLTMPTLLIAGSEDLKIPPDHVEQLYDAIPEEQKTFKIIEGAPHCCRTKKDLNTLRKYMNEWLDRTIK